MTAFLICKGCTLYINFIDRFCEQMFKEVPNNEHIIAVIIELNHGIAGFNQDEMKEILRYISTI